MLGRLNTHVPPILMLTRVLTHSPIMSLKKQNKRRPPGLIPAAGARGADPSRAEVGWGEGDGAVGRKVAGTRPPSRPNFGLYLSVGQN